VNYLTFESKFLSMKRLYFWIAIMVPAVMPAQVPLTGSFTDCNNTTKSIQPTLGTGRSIVIAHKAVDCSVCASQSASLQTQAAKYKDTVEVWAAMSWKYSANAFSNPCSSTTAWASNYSWNDIFTFPDTGRVFVNNATPYYYVYSALDSSLKYQGTNRTLAFNTALQNSLVGVRKVTPPTHFKLYARGGQLVIEGLNPAAGARLQVYDLSGKLIMDQSLHRNPERLGIDASGILLVDLQTSGTRHRRKIYLNL
jgi:hypothetical protein